MNYKELYDKVMPPQKRESERYNIWVAYVSRPLSVLCTLPFVETKTSPTTITKISVVVTLAGFVFLVGWPSNMTFKLIGWALFFLWNVLDGVDGNLARATDRCSPIGELWDAIGGYTAMVLLYFSAGIMAFFDANSYGFCEPHWLLILGGATAVMSIFPRLIFQKKQCIKGFDDKSRHIFDKKSFSLSQMIAANFISSSGLLQVIFLVAILTHCLNFFVAVYSIINLVILLASLHRLVKV